MKYSTIIFDLDGTLLNTLDDLTASVNYAMNKCGFPERTLDEIRRFVGNGVHVLIDRATPEGITDEQYKAAYDAFEEHYAVHKRDKTAPYEGVVDLLNTLKGKGYKLAIVSNKLDFAVKALNDEIFGGVVDAAIGDSDKTRTKPEPDMVYKAVEQLGVDISECIYVGDTNVDLATARNSGIPCISVSWGFRSTEELISCGADMIAHNTEDVLKYIEG